MVFIILFNEKINSVYEEYCCSEILSVSGVHPTAKLETLELLTPVLHILSTEKSLIFETISLEFLVHILYRLNLAEAPQDPCCC